MPIRQALLPLALVAAAIVAHPTLARAQLPTARAESIGLSTERLGRIRPVMQSFVDRGEEAGVIWLVARNGKLVERGAVGMQDVAGKQPMRTDTIVRMASMTKPVTAVAIMILLEEGRLVLSDPVSKYLPVLHGLKVADKNGKLVPSQRDPTIRDLLTHRAGFTYGFFPGPVSETYRKLGVSDGLEGDITLEENVKRLAQAPLVDQPGHDFHYGLSYDVLGRVIEVVSGKPLDVFFQERIFKPLRMSDTGFAVPPGKLSRLATVYHGSSDGKLVPSAEPEKLGRLMFSPTAHYRAPHLLSGGGGLVSTASDYARFLSMLLGGGQLDGVRILSPKSVQLMTVSHTRDLPHEAGDNGQDVGLGFGVLMDLGASAQLGSVGMFGWAGVFGTQFFVDPKEKIVAVLLTQRPLYEGTLGETFQSLVYASVMTAY